MLAPYAPKQNHFPAALADAGGEHLLPIPELTPYELGSRREIAVVGNQGTMGVPLFTGGATTPNSPVVQSAGHTYRFKASHLKWEFRRGGPLRHLLLGYPQALITPMARTTVHNRQHAVEQLLCRRPPLSATVKRRGDCLLSRNTAIADRFS
jgi:hypothetical protein